MSILWSAVNNAFFLSVDTESFVRSGWDLKDAIPVSDDVFDEYAAIPPDGKIRSVGEGGMPCWEDAPKSPPPSPEEQVAQADAVKSTLQREAEDAIKPLERAKSLGIATPQELALLTEWEKYTVYLMRVDTSTAPNITWPVKPAAV
ncbi:MAG: tail fiber assembly protein [Plesiomonas sp.]